MSEKDEGFISIDIIKLVHTLVEEGYLSAEDTNAGLKEMGIDDEE